MPERIYLTGFGKIDKKALRQDIQQQVIAEGEVRAEELRILWAEQAAPLHPSSRKGKQTF
ncbi:MAG: hypothetical protein KGJ86_06335 [Chloroflexota bacterium]|nr:hypothetical protein [Chloroflexota bacterium]